jgi:hypothetical protein
MRAMLTAAALLFLPLPSPARAQSGATLSGRITGPAGEPVASALIQVALPGTANGPSTRSDAAGSYALELPPGPGSFTLSVARIGYEPHREVLSAPGPGARVVRDIRLATRTALLDALEVVAFPPVLRDTPGGPGGTGGGGRSSTFVDYPMEPGSLADAALFSAGVVPLGEGGSGLPPVSIAGQAAAQNRVTVDGAGYGGAALPAEGVRSVGVVSSTYDVSRGQFTGGQIAATTHSGTTDHGGALRIRVRARPLSLGRSPEASGPDGSLAQVSAAYGGALAGERWFGFGAVQWIRREWQGWTLDGAAPATLRRRGLDPDSVRRFADVLGELGVPRRAPSSDAAQEGSAVVRLDWKASAVHTLFTRLDGRWSAVPLPSPSLSTASATAESRRADAGVLLALTSAVGAGSNELRAYATLGRGRSSGGYGIPGGSVLVGSPGAGLSRLQFGGAAGEASRSGRLLLEVSDAWRGLFARGRHRVQAGFTLSAEQVKLRSFPNAQGTFAFATLDDLAALRPVSFTRGLQARDDALTSTYAAAWLGHAVQLSQPLSATYGVRVEGTRFGGRHGLDPAVTAAFPGLPGSVPSAALLSPRAGFTWLVPSSRAGVSHITVTGGAGRFIGPSGLDALALAAGEVGTPQAELACVGAAAPVPDWRTYAADPASIPETCAGSGGELEVRTAPATIFSPSFRTPSVWRGSLGVSWQPVPRTMLGIQGMATRGTGQSTAVDLNLAAAPAFTLDAEGERPVYAPAAAIESASGLAAPGASRRVPALAAVREIGGGRSGGMQVTLHGFTVPGGSSILMGSYTYTRSWDEAAGLAAPGGAPGYAAANPWRAVRAPADYERRHALQLRYARLFRDRFQAGVIASATSGVPYTPWVAGDVNADGEPNDPAFVFDDAAAETSVAAGMGALLEDAPSGARSCLRRQLGRTADRNSCRGPWTAGLDLQVDFAPAGIRRNGMRFTVTASNLPGLADWLAHGSEDLRGWGQTVVPDGTLLYVRGFDPAARAYRYEVNPAFGQSLGRRAQPGFAITVQVRMTVGTDPAEQWVAQESRAYRGQARPAHEIRAGIGQRVRSLPGQVLALADSLGLQLAPAQTGSLRLLADSVQIVLPPLLDSLAAAASEADTASGPTAPARVRQRMLTGMVQETLDSIQAQVRTVLTPAQWERLPAPWRQPAAARPIVPMKPMVVDTEDVW